MRKLDITDKLKFEEKPVLAFNGKAYELDDSAVMVLEVMELVGDNPAMTDLIDAAKRVFGERYTEVVADCKTFTNLMIAIEAAIDLVTDEEVGKPLAEVTPSTISSPIGI